MIVLLYFDWKGNGGELKHVTNMIKKACEKGDVIFKGLYRPDNIKWNWGWMFETESYDKFMEVMRNNGRPVNMTHYIVEMLFLQNYD